MARRWRKSACANFEILKRFRADQVQIVPENAICLTMTSILNTEGIVLEPAGALSLSVLEALGPEKLAGKTVVAVVSGGNFEFRAASRRQGAGHAPMPGRRNTFVLRLAQRPGALKDFLNLLGPDDDIARFEYLKKSARNFGSILIGIETKAPENFHRLTAAFDQAGLSYQDITDNEIISNLII